MNPTVTNPPQPPGIRRQMTGAPAWMMAVSQNVGRGIPAAGAPAAGLEPGMNSQQLVADRLRAIAQLLTEVVQVLSVSNPSLLPIAKVMAEAGAELMNSVMSAETAPAGGNEQPEIPAQEIAGGGVGG